MIKFTIPGLASPRVTATHPEGKAYHALRLPSGLHDLRHHVFGRNSAIPELVDRGFIRPGNRVVLVNTASAEKYLPALRSSLDGGL